MSDADAANLFSNRELAQTRLLIALDAAQLGTWDRDLMTGMLTFDARSAAMYGITRQTFQGDEDNEVYRCVHPDDRARVREVVAAAVAAQGDVDVEFRIIRPDATTRWLYTRGQVLPDATGRPARITGTNADVTAAHNAAHQQMADARAMAGLVTAAQELGEADTEADVLAVVNRSAITLLGTTGCALTLPEPDRSQVRTLSLSFPDQVMATFIRSPVDFPRPAVHTAITGIAHFLTDRTDAEALFPGAIVHYSTTNTQASAAVALRTRDQLIGALSVAYPDAHDWRPAERDLLEAFAALTAQALNRLAAQDAEHAATAAAQRSAAEQGALVTIASALDGARTEDEVLAVVTSQGVSMLGAEGGVLCLRGSLLSGRGASSPQTLRTLTTTFFNDQVRSQVAELPTDFPLPMVDTATTGTPYFFTDRAGAVALFPGAAGLYAAANTYASAAVPLRAAGEVIGSLSIAFDTDRSWPSSDRELLEAFAALTSQALERIAARQAERAASQSASRFSETLQRSLLTSPPQPDHLQIAVRYNPAAADAQVGGDWYDAFLTAGGSTSLVIGDVTGHDQYAAAAMGQLRNLLRGIGYAVGEPPARVLTVLDHAAHDLAVKATATIVVAQIEQSPAQHEAGTRLLRWSNAGHPAPLLITPEATTHYLDTDPDLMVGVDPDTSRTDHETLLPPGATVLFFTDGLIERRNAPLQAGLDWLAHTTRDLAHLELDELCDALLALVGDRVEDDVALLAVRAHPEDAPRPPEAGPGDDPLKAPTLSSDSEA